MITLFNRKELISTYDMGEQSEIRDILAQNKIDYDIKTLNRKSPSSLAAGSRARTGTFGEKLDLEYEYTIYVKKDDYEEAAYLIKDVKPR